MCSSSWDAPPAFMSLYQENVAQCEFPATTSSFFCESGNVGREDIYSYCAETLGEHGGTRKGKWVVEGRLGSDGAAKSMIHLSTIWSTLVYGGDACFFEPFRDLSKFKRQDLRQIQTCFAVYLGSYLCFRTFYGDRKLRAWIPSLVCAFFSTAFGAVTLYEAYNAGFSPAFFSADRETDASRWAIMFLFTGSIFDTCAAIYDYIEHFGMLTGWIHHSLYSLLNMIALGKHLTNDLALHCVEELPTFLLATGKMGIFRTDIGFGATFFVLRIAYHFSLVVYIYTELPADAPPRRYLLVRCLTLALHVHWFLAWYRGYMKRRRAKNDRKIKTN